MIPQRQTIDGHVFPLCAQSVAMTLIPHLRSDHKIEPEVFKARFPEHPLCSERFAGFILQQILEPHGHLLLTDTGEDISPHPDFRLVARTP